MPDVWRFLAAFVALWCLGGLPAQFPDDFDSPLWAAFRLISVTLEPCGESRKDITLQKKPTPTFNRKFEQTAAVMNRMLNHFPNHEKYGLTQEIRRAMYGTYRYFVESYKRYHKKTTLTNLDIQHETWRMLVNLAFELGYFNYKDSRNPSVTGQDRHKRISMMIDELGRIIGGWMRSEASPT